VRLLFVKTSLAWPRASGHDVYTFHSMKAFAALGHDVSLATVRDPEPAAIEGLSLKHHVRLGSDTEMSEQSLPGTWLQRKYRSFWGISPRVLSDLQAAVTRFGFDAVVAVGLDALPYMPVLKGTARIWFPADEWIWHHLTQLRPFDRTTWGNLRDAAIKGVYERAHTGVVDRSWVVSETDRRAMRWLAGMKNVDILSLGVDTDYYRPAAVDVQPRTAVFWGRLDFGPNIQALEWFCKRVWPRVRQKVADAKFTVIGFQPSDEVRALVGRDGITLEANLADLRGAARSHALAVMPFVSGAGIKNKLLEAAAMGIPIVGTKTAGRGLRGNPPIEFHSNPEAMAGAMVDLWQDNERRTGLGEAGRAWVLEHHTWSAMAREATARLEAQMLVER
jgi:glycosyltransferase involved in cell wall biosynthesis